MIRVLALAVLERDDGRLLLEKGADRVKNETFYRCLGGGVEFGEKGAAAVVREFREEIGRDIAVDAFLGAVENIFEWEGQPGHQIMLLYRCRFVNLADYERKDMPRLDGGGETYWKSLAEIAAEKALLHPARMPEFLKNEGVTS